jgi:hypothetical protein
VARENLRAWGAAAAVHLGAVGRSDRALGRTSMSGYPTTWDGLANTGGGHVRWNAPDGTVPALAFDRIVEDALALAPARSGIRLLKLDCEGSEWPILFTSRRLDAMEAIVGEYHELARDDPDRFETAREWDCTGRTLGAFLRGAGFDVEVSASNAARLGRFAARRAGRKAAA